MDHIEQDGLRPDFNLPRFFKNRFNLAILALIFVGLLLLFAGAGLFLFRGSTPNESNDDIKIISSDQQATGAQIVVHVDGAVKAPGVYHLSADSRVSDAVAAAGGLSTNADSSKINLAAKISDGQKLHMASVNETGSLGTKFSPVVSNEMGSPYSGQISINSASQAELEGLPAVGPVTAGKIIGGRPYSQVDELISKKIVGKSTFEKIKDLISL